ncbi:MAG: glycosyltransferase [Kiritimatiellia bacterium]
MTTRLLWWGRFDPLYSRNGVLREQMRALKIEITDFHPVFSRYADLEAALRRLPRPNAVWLPCFRQRDVAAARRWCDRQGLPLIFDPLISAYDKQLFERFKLKRGSRAAIRLLRWEQHIFSMADHVIADTPCHAQFFQEHLGVDANRISVIYVGAEENLFQPQIKTTPSDPINVLFYGSYIPLHGAQTIIEAARCYSGPPVRWHMLGNGPARAECEKNAQGLTNLCFESYLPYSELPRRIHQADILLGVFGTTAKAGRVMPNKIFQALAAGRPVITRASEAYPIALRNSPALQFVEPGSPTALAQAVKEWAEEPKALQSRGAEAAAVYRRHLSATVIQGQISRVLLEK